MPGRTVPDEYLEPLSPAEVETKVRRSLFIARLDPCRSEGEARTALARVQAAHRDATHNCWACLLGPDPVVEFSSDAGEPSGTAGRPILGALKRSGMVNLVVVVTRYFGGVKLGVRGLIEAYGGAADLAVAAACPVRRILSRPLSVRLSYPAIGPVTRLLEDWDAVDLRRGSPGPRPRPALARGGAGRGALRDGGLRNGPGVARRGRPSVRRPVTGPCRAR